MTYFPWEARYDLGIVKMDLEHRGLIALMNRLHHLNDIGASHAKLKEVLLELEQRTIEHFEHEELYQESIRYPGIVQHKSIHAGLLNQFGEHKKRFLIDCAGVSLEFFTFFKLWLSAHIAGIDHKYAHYAMAPRRATS